MSVLEAPVRAEANHHDKFHKLVATAQKHPPVKVAVAHPCDQVSLESAVEAAGLKLIEPILVGPEQRIREVASKHGLDISRFEIVDADDRQGRRQRVLLMAVEPDIDRRPLGRRIIGPEVGERPAERLGVESARQFVRGGTGQFDIINAHRGAPSNGG